MLSLRATVLNVFQAPEGQTKEGEQYGGGYKVQLQGRNILKNNQTRIDLITLTVKDPTPFQDRMEKTIQVDVGAFSNGKTIQFYIPENYSIQTIENEPEGKEKKSSKPDPKSGLV